MILTRLLKKFVLLQIVNGKQNPRIARLYTARTSLSLFCVKFALVPRLGPRVVCYARTGTASSNSQTIPTIFQPDNARRTSV